MEQATDDNQGGGDARLRGEGHVERPLLVSCAESERFKVVPFGVARAFRSSMCITVVVVVASGSRLNIFIVVTLINP